MKEKMLMKGNEAIAEAALRAKCRYYFCYPITPQTEISHYFAKKMPEYNGTFIQAESEIAAINMVYGASSAGARAMTSSSGPGMSLKQEGLSYLAGSQLPAVVVDIMRCGPGLGGILPSQGDYFQAVKGGGHGDYNMVVLAPNSVQEMYDLTVEAFNIADKYRVVSMILADGVLGQMMETVEFNESENINKVNKDWAVTGTKMERPPNVITSVFLEPEVLEAHNNKLQEKYQFIKQNEVRVELYNCEDAEIIVVAYGITSRIVRGVIQKASEQGIRVGLIRPISLWPFPEKEIENMVHIPKAFLVVELSAGQMVYDVKSAVCSKKPVYFYGRTGGMIPTQDEILNKIKEII